MDIVAVLTNGCCVRTTWPWSSGNESWHQGTVEPQRKWHGPRYILAAGSPATYETELVKGLEMGVQKHYDFASDIVDRGQRRDLDRTAHQQL